MGALQRALKHELAFRPFDHFRRLGFENAAAFAFLRSLEDAAGACRALSLATGGRLVCAHTLLQGPVSEGMHTLS